MTLIAGSRLGPYEIVAPIGAGGMGEVWRARDPRLNRDVAVKVLPAAFTADPERMTRFDREAQVLASLNHAHIAAIYGIENAGDARALVLEFVGGETLAEKLAGGPLEPGEALGIARQIADALEAAHEKGIVHRDLKPANVKVTPWGEVKVLDFGLAKALAGDPSSPDMSHSPTITAAATRDGIVIGTAAYMSPEQARGKPIDKRTDIWAFGVLLYEMLTGHQAFRGETVSDTLAAILMRDPDWSALPASAPAPVRKLLARCLERDRNHRLHDIADARIEIEEALAELRGTSNLSAARVSVRERRPQVSLVSLGLLSLLGLALLVGAFFAGRRSGTAPRGLALPIRSIVPLPEGTRLAGWASPTVAFSRDGRNLAFVAISEKGVQQLYVYRLETGETRVVPDSDNAEGPFFSPDGQWVAFATEVSTGRPSAGKLKKFSLSTGLTQPICEILDYFGGTWGDDDTIRLVIEEQKGIWKVPGGGGTATPVVSNVRVGGKDESHSIVWPQPLPGGKSLIVYDEDASRWGNARVLDLSTRELRDIAPSALSPRHVPTGHLLYVDPGGTLFAVPFDLSRGQMAGSPVAAVKGVAISGNLAAVLAVSDSGSLVYATGAIRGSRHEPRSLCRLDRAGAITPLPADPGDFGSAIRVSPDGRRLALTTWDLNLWIYDLERRSRIRLPNTRVVVYDFPLWTADGDRIAFGGATEGEHGWKIFVQKADGTGEPEILVAGGASEKHPTSFGPRGELLYDVVAGPEESGTWVLPPGGKDAPRRLLAGSRSASVSPDGHWLTYISDESGTFEVYVQSYPELGHKRHVSVGGGGDPRWSRDGREIVYVRDGFYAVDFEAGAEPKIGEPRLLFKKPGIGGYDVAPDGKGFYAVFQPPESGIVRELHLVTNWFEELNRLAPTGKN